MGVMSVEAASAYMLQLRKRAFSSQAEAAKATTELLRAVMPDAKVDASTISRIERGEGKEGPNSFILGAFVQAIGGRMQDVQKLLLDPKATATDGRDLADAILRGFEAGGALEYVKTPEDVAELMRYFQEELTAIRQEERRGLMAELRGYFAGLRAGRRRNAD